MKKLILLLLLISIIGIGRAYLKDTIIEKKVFLSEKIKIPSGAFEEIANNYEIKSTSRNKRIVKRNIDGRELVLHIVVEGKKSRVINNPVNPRIRRKINGRAAVYIDGDVKRYNIEGIQDKKVSYKSLLKTIKLLRESKIDVENDLIDMLEDMIDGVDRFEIAEVILGLADKDEEKLEVMMSERKIIEGNIYQEAIENAIEYLIENI